jgi:hypothetical protein
MTRVLPPYLGPSQWGYSYTLPLGERTYTYSLRWLEQQGAWYLDLADADGPIIVGVRVVLGALYGARLRNPRMPPGYIACEDLSGAEQEPTRESLGQQHVLVWVVP